MTKILFTDLDDTLLTTQKQVCPENQKAIRELIHHGHKIVLTTGRSLPSALNQAEHLNLTFHGCYIISFNGGEIYDIYHKVSLYKSRLPMELVKSIFQLAETSGVHVQTYDDFYVLSHQKNNQLLRYCQTMACEYRIAANVLTSLKDGPSKILLIDYENHSILDEMRKIILEQYGNQVDSFYSNPAYLEVVAKGTNKGNAIKKLCSILNIPLENTIAAGDAMNDIPMLKTAYVGAAVSNADECVKEAADYITAADHNHGAVAEIIQKFILS